MLLHNNASLIGWSRHCTRPAPTVTPVRYPPPARGEAFGLASSIRHASSWLRVRAHKCVCVRAHYARTLMRAPAHWHAEAQSTDHRVGYLELIVKGTEKKTPPPQLTCFPANSGSRVEPDTRSATVIYRASSRIHHLPPWPFVLPRPFCPHPVLLLRLCVLPRPIVSSRTNALRSPRFPLREDKARSVATCCPSTPLRGLIQMRLRSLPIEIQREREGERGRGRQGEGG